MERVHWPSRSFKADEPEAGACRRADADPTYSIVSKRSPGDAGVRAGAIERPTHSW